MKDLGMDSLDAVEVVMAFEDEFGKFRQLPTAPRGWMNNLMSICFFVCFCLDECNLIFLVCLFTGSYQLWRSLMKKQKRYSHARTQ